MNKIKQLIFATLLLLNFASFSQQNQFTKEPLTISPEEKITNAPIRNHNAANIKVGNVILDKRAGKYYNAEDLIGITEEQAKLINATYINTFDIIEFKNSLDASCKENIKNNFDLGPYNHHRKLNERVILPIIFEGCVFRISLYSWNEVNSIK